ncbi:MAG: hypothetical protein ACKPKO_07950 [Candidatus Fonsibacter sp.]
MAQSCNYQTYSTAHIYGYAGRIYIRYHAQIETKPNGRNNIGGSRPAFSKFTKLIDYTSGSGHYYSLRMGREFKLGCWSVLLDFDNKADNASQSGIDLINKLNMDQYYAPKQNTPSGVPLHCVRRRPTEGSDHNQYGEHTPGR